MFRLKYDQIHNSDPEVIAKLDKLGIEPFYQSGERYKKFVLDEGDAIKALKLR